jgi:hypothetical protein
MARSAGDRRRLAKKTIRKGGKGWRPASRAHRTERTPQKAVPPELRFSDWRGRFLKTLKRWPHNITRAAAAGRVSRSHAYALREKDRAFSLAWDEIRDGARDEAGHALYHRAVHGWNEPVFHEGCVVGRRRVFNAALLIFVNKCLDPRVYNLAPGDAGEAGSGGREVAAEFGRALAGMFRAVPKPAAASA